MRIPTSDSEFKDTVSTFRTQCFEWILEALQTDVIVNSKKIMKSFKACIKTDQPKFVKENMFE